MNNFPKGSDLLVRWAIKYSDGTPFPLENYAWELCYSAGRGINVVKDTAVISVSDNLLTWRFSGKDQAFYGKYSLTLRLYQQGKIVATVSKNNAFELSTTQYDGPCDIDLVSYCDNISLQDALLRGNKAMEVAQDAKSTAGSAVERAVSAETIAQNAVDAVNIAITTSQAANTTAGNAKTIADQAKATADATAATATQKAEEVAQKEAQLEAALNNLSTDQSGALALSTKVNEHGEKLSELEKKFKIIKNLYKSSGNSADYTSGAAAGICYLLWKPSEGWNNKSIPYYIPKGSSIKRVKIVKREGFTANLVLLKRNSTNWSFTIKKIVEVPSNVDVDLSDEVMDDDYFIGIASKTANAIVLGNNIIGGDAVSLISSTLTNEGDTIVFSSLGVNRCLNVDIDIITPVDNSHKQETNITVGRDKVFTNPVSAIQALTDSSKENIYNVFVDEGEYDILAYLGGTTWLNTLTENDYMAGLFPTDYVNIYGKGNTIFKCEIPDSVATLLTSTQVSTINLRYNNKLDGITFIAKNVRYACHDETRASTEEGCHDKNRIVTNCKFIHKGNKAGLWSSPLGYAGGFQYGDRFVFKNCVFSGVSWHDQSIYEYPSVFEIDSCIVWQSMKFGSVASGRNHKVTITNTIIGRCLQNIEETSGSGVGNGFEITGGGNSIVPSQYVNKMPVFSNECFYKTSGSNSTIPKGTPLKHQFGAVLPMTDADDISLFAGIAMEDIPANGNGFGLVKRYGYIMLSDIGITPSAYGVKLSIVGTGISEGDNKPIMIVNGHTKGYACIIV